MQVSVVAAVSIDGKLTRHDESDVRQWTSDEDKHHFSSMIESSDVLIMGRGTYDVVQPRTSRDKLRIVLTSQPEKYNGQSVPGQLEFVNETPAKVVERLTAGGHKQALIVGGTGTISPFLEANKVDYLYLTVEPLVFGDGKPLAAGKLSNQFTLEKFEKVNDRGTLLLTYKAVK